MSQKPLCYFLKKEGDQIHFYNEHFDRIQPASLNGLFSFVCYPTSVVMGPLADYASRHQGLMTLVMVVSQQLSKHRYPFFSSSIRGLLPKGGPIAGGGVWLNQGDIVLWHLKSGSISLDNPACHDQHPDLARMIQHIGFPSDRRLTLTQTDWFESQYMRQLFLENGDYIEPSTAPAAIQQVKSALIEAQRKRRRWSRKFKSLR